MKFSKLFLTLFLGVTLTACTQNTTPLERARELQKSILTIDTHSDTPMYMLSEGFDLTQDGSGFVDFPKMKKGLLDVESFAVYTSSKKGNMSSEEIEESYAAALNLYNEINKLAVDNPEIVGIAGSPADMYRLKAEGKSIILPTMENSLPIANDISRVEEFYNKGNRIFGLCHNYNNQICDSSTDDPEYGGLSEFGEEVVKEINRLGAIIDVSHASDDTFFDAAKLSKTPIIASHSSVRALCDVKRNFSDSMLFALKENGGVIQLCIYEGFIKIYPKSEAKTAYWKDLSPAFNTYFDSEKTGEPARTKAREMFFAARAKHPEFNVTVKDLVDHIDYIVDLIGVDYVGIGTDFEGGGGLADCYDASELPNITVELMARGYSDEDIAKIWGGNFVRVFNEAIAYSESLK